MDARGPLTIARVSRNSRLITDTQKLDHRPKSLPKKRDPTYSNCHSGQGGINSAILLIAYFSPFSWWMLDPCLGRHKHGVELAGGLSIEGFGGPLVDRQFVRFDVNRQQGNSDLTQDISFLRDEAFVV